MGCSRTGDKEPPEHTGTAVAHRTRCGDRCRHGESAGPIRCRNACLREPAEKVAIGIVVQVPRSESARWRRTGNAQDLVKSGEWRRGPSLNSYYTQPKVSRLGGSSSGSDS